ncbi:hypothetical protein KSF_037490 [Reticulibacter mediterranei]|uniref:Uncharacterized protein n=1 Tax=Reticulibacter mediterranei TaxID=2778369 RepID=A0A8J3IFP9_9CHLR|nr:hypothetical protein [Reticulibacter mediterranei]GHO93701.1 hypothetical protein KSF_037490 [Reticulibacter mediterranei]
MVQFAFIYHMAEAANWPVIQRNGLHSTSALLDLADICGEDRERLEKQQRLTHTELLNGVQLRDQRPMPPTALANCLIGLTPSEWYALINARVFFWLDPARLNRHRAACEPRPQVVLTVDASKLVAAYAEKIAVTPINTGNARRRPARRGAATFVPYAAWITSAWTSEAASLGTPVRPSSHHPVELTVTGSIPDIMQFVVEVQQLAPGQLFTPAYH